METRWVRRMNVPTVHVAATACALGITIPACSPIERDPPRSASAVLPATKYIARAFQTYPLVALSELHGNEESKALFTSIVRDPDFQRAASDIVVEFGNARFQDAVDRYLAGVDVPRDELAHAWRDTTQVSGIFNLPMYEEMLQAVREVNRTLPPQRRLRVWLGDPPIDWERVTSPADEDMNDWRDAFFARVVQDRILSRKRKALLFIGGAHISRTVIWPNSLIHLLDARHPGKTHVVSIFDIGAVPLQVAERLREWPAGIATGVRGSWLDRLVAADIGFRFASGTVGEDIDAVALLSHSPLAYAPPPPVDPASPYGAELERRRRLAAATVPFRGGRIRFELDRTTLVPGARAALEDVAGELERNPALELLVKAFADAGEAAPEALSTRRAHVVAEWLTQRGVDVRRLTPRGCGTVRPVTIGRTEPEREQNRRAELVRRTPMAGCEPPW
jgi:outer membrane protein OmpA-like peptidoglycan-associated protein